MGPQTQRNFDEDGDRLVTGKFLSYLRRMLPEQEGVSIDKCRDTVREMTVEPSSAVNIRLRFQAEVSQPCFRNTSNTKWEVHTRGRIAAEFAHNTVREEFGKICPRTVVNFDPLGDSYPL